MSLDEALNLAIPPEDAEKNTQAFSNMSNPLNLSAFPESENNVAATTSIFRRRCFFCGSNVYQRIKCPAVNDNSQICLKKGPFANLCKSGWPQWTHDVNEHDGQCEGALSAISAASPSSLRKATVPLINRHLAEIIKLINIKHSFI